MTRKTATAEIAVETPERSAARPVLPGSSRYVQSVPLGELVESPRNPRKRFDPAALEELTSSVREKGVLTPLLVRPVPGWGEMPGPRGRVYEIAAGHRRYRAARAAGLDGVPVVAREMSDAELLEVLVIENDQREDVHPLEEAAGYQALQKTAGYDVARIAARVGRSEKYVYDRLKLLQLTPRAQDLFLRGKFEAGHAILIARLPAEEQGLLVDPEKYGGLRDGLFEEERAELPFEGMTPEQSSRAEAKDPYLGVKAVSVRELADHIQRHVRARREAVDPFLFPETANLLAVHADDKLKAIAITREYMAADSVRASAGGERVHGEQGWKRADGLEKSKPCEASRIGFVVSGPGQGQAFLVCVNKEKCAVHWGAWQKERAKRRRSMAGVGDAAGKQEDYDRQEQRRKEQQAAHEAARKRWNEALPAILEALAAAVKKAPAGGEGPLAGLVVGSIGEEWHRRRAAKMASAVPRGRAAEDLVRHAAFLSIVVAAQGYDAENSLRSAAKALGVDVGAILNRAAPVQTSAKKPARLKKRGR